MGERLTERLFPGSRVVWLAALVMTLVVALGLGKFLMKQPLALTGTNSVDVGAVVARAEAGQLTCVRNLVVPPDTGRIEVWVGVQNQAVPRPLLQGSLTAADGRAWRVRSRLDENPAGLFRELALRPASTGEKELPATFCFRVKDAALDLGGASVNLFPGAKPSTVGGVPLPTTDVAVHFLTKRHTGSRLFTRINTAFERAVLFKDVPGGTAVMWLLLACFSLVAYVVIRTAATVEQLSVKTLTRRATGVAAFAGIAWALMLPPLHGADESEHLAYAQSVAERGQRADAAPSARPPYSTDELVLLGALRHSSSILNHSSRVRWDSLSEQRYRQALKEPVTRSDGGGYTESATGHSPLYYSLVAVPYKLFAGRLNLAQVSIIMRVFTALMAALIAGLAVWCASLLLPRLPAAWWLAGVLVALQPVFNSISGTINNDTLVNLLAAIVVTLLVHAWRKGPQLRTMAGLGAATVLLPVAKITGFALWPVVGLGLLLVLAAHHRRADLVRLTAIPGAAILVFVVWAVVVAPIVGGDRGALLNVHPTTPTAAPDTTASAGITHADQLNYLVQMVLPFVHIGPDAWAQKWPLYSVYVERGYGRFGWLDAGLPFKVLQLITVAVLAGWLVALAAAVRHRDRWRHWVPGATILALTVLSVVTFVAVAYTTTSPRPIPGEQGRYIFPAIVPMAVLLAGGVGVIAGRGRAIIIGVTAAMLPMFALFSWLAALTDYYT